MVGDKLDQKWLIWNKYYEAMVPELEQEEMVWDTMKNFLMHWLDNKQLHRWLYSGI